MEFFPADLSLKLPFGVPGQESSCPVTLAGIPDLSPSLSAGSLWHLSPHFPQAPLTFPATQPSTRSCLQLDDCLHSHLYSVGVSPSYPSKLCLHSPRTAQDPMSDHAVFGWTLSGLHLSGHIPLPAFPMCFAISFSHTNPLSLPRRCGSVSTMPFSMLFPCYRALFPKFSSWKHSYSYCETQCQLTLCDYPTPSSLFPE